VTTGLGWPTLKSTPYSRPLAFLVIQVPEIPGQGKGGPTRQGPKHKPASRSTNRADGRGPELSAPVSGAHPQGSSIPAGVDVSAAKGKKKSVKGGFEACKNPFFEYLWKGHESLRGFAGNSLPVSRAVCNAMERWLKDNPKEADMRCLSMATLAYTRDAYDLRVGGPLERGVPATLKGKIDECMSLCAVHGWAFSFYVLEEVNGYYSLQRSESRIRDGICVVHILLIPGPNGSSHAVPIPSPNMQFRAKVIPAVSQRNIDRTTTFDEVIGPESPGMPLPAAKTLLEVPPSGKDVATGSPTTGSSPVAGVEPPPTAAPLPVAQTLLEVPPSGKDAATGSPTTGSSPVAGDEPPPTTTTSVQTDTEVVDQQLEEIDAEVLLALGRVTQEDFVELDSSSIVSEIASSLFAVGTPEWSMSAVEQKADYPKYAGLYPPFKGAHWLFGWDPKYGKEASLSSSLLGMVYRPDICSATERMVSKFGATVLYYGPPEVRFRKYFPTTEGKERCFAVGDCVRVNNVTYTAVEVHKWGQSLIRLVRTEAGLLALLFPDTPCASGISLFNGEKPVKIFTPPVAINAAMATQAQWTMEVLTTKDPVNLAVMNRMRQVVGGLEDPSSAPSADVAADYVRDLRRYYPDIVDVTGPFEWGYCYSCGAKPKGKLAGRVCKECLSKNSDLGRMVEGGYHICSPAAPIRYPGVVCTRTRHPRLKSGVQTCATAGNFPVAPTESRQSCLPNHQAALDLGLVGSA